MIAPAMPPRRNVAIPLCLAAILTASVAGAEGPVAWWSFNSVTENVATDRATDRGDSLEGNHRLIDGAVGKALLFDGFTTVIDRPAPDTPHLTGDFSIEAWVAQGAYPWNWCPLITQQRNEQAGYAFSVGPRGQIRLQVAAEGEWHSCTSDDWALPLRKWVYVAGTFEPGKGITLYVDGQSVATLELEGQVTFAPDVDLRIGANHKPTKPSNIQRYNFRSPYDPVIIYEPGNRMHYVKDRDIRGYERPGACNHWPVGQARCDGRTVQAADRPTHFLGFPISYPPVHESEGRSWWNGIYGMTDLPMEKPVTLARSWNFPSGIEVDEGFEDRGYDRGQRALVLERSDGAATDLRILVAATEDSPVYNPALLILGWGDSDAAITIDGEEVPRGPNLRLGHRHGLESADLIVWIEREATEPFEIAVRPRQEMRGSQLL